MNDCLDNINPPSLFNEVSQMDEPTTEAHAQENETMCQASEIRSEEASHHVFDERIDEISNETDDAVTPIPSEYCVSSSAESTPKKRLLKTNLTPKQKRQLAKERYQTYTIAAERVKKEEEDRKKQDQIDNENIEEAFEGKSSPFSRLTPKQRRQEDRARFQTQVLDTPVLSQSDNPTEKSSNEKQNNKTSIQSLIKSGIPSLKKYTSKIARLNQSPEIKNKERSRLSVFNANNSSSKEVYVNSPVSLNQILHKSEPNSNLVLNETSDASLVVETNRNDDIISCETSSLVSNHSGNDSNSQLLFMNGVSKKLSHLQLQQASEEDFSLYINEDDQDESKSESENEDSSSGKEDFKEFKGPRIVKQVKPLLSRLHFDKLECRLLGAIHLLLFDRQKLLHLGKITAIKNPIVHQK